MAVENGYVPEEYLDEALFRQARVWMMLGFFDDPSTILYNKLVHCRSVSKTLAIFLSV